MDDPYSKLFAEEERFKRALALADPAAQIFSHTSEVIRARELALRGADDALRMNRIIDQQRHLDFDRVGLGYLFRESQSQPKFLSIALDEHRLRAALGAAAEFQYSIDRAREQQSIYDRSFRMMRTDELDRFNASIRQAELAVPRYLGATQAAMSQMHSPWINSNDVDASIRAFTGLQAIGMGITYQRPFDENLSAFLRRGLGDWREVTAQTLPANIIDNPIARSDFYVGLGFDPDLTNFPIAAFRETTRLAGLSSAEGDDDEADLDRNERAYQQLLPFEIRVRTFIEKVMANAFGPDWMDSNLPDGLLTAWKDKQQKAKLKGDDRPVIEFADFTDYIRIIELKRNWRTVFCEIFERPSDVQESFVRLFPVRLCTMHARLITPDDELLLMSETRRILRAIEDASQRLSPP